MHYKLVIYDFDGTLADTFPYFLMALDRLSRRYRVKSIGPEEVEALRGLDARQILRQYRVPGWKMALAGFDYRRMMNRDIQQIPLFEGVERLLSFMAERGVQQAVVSSNARKIIERVLGPQNAAHICHYEYRVSLLGKGEKIRKVVQKSGVGPGEAIYIGDEIRDIHAARAEGIDFGAVTWGYTLPHALQAHQPDLIFSSVQEMIEKMSR